MSNLRARRIAAQDFARFDHVIAMDRHNLELLAGRCPPEFAHKLALYCDFHPDYAGREVPDPYYGGPRGFEEVLDLSEAVNASLLARLRRRTGLRTAPGACPGARHACFVVSTCLSGSVLSGRSRGRTRGGRGGGGGATLLAASRIFS